MYTYMLWTSSNVRIVLHFQRETMRQFLTGMHKTTHFKNQLFSGLCEWIGQGNGNPVQLAWFQVQLTQIWKCFLGLIDTRQEGGPNSFKFGFFCLKNMFSFPLQCTRTFLLATKLYEGTIFNDTTMFVENSSKLIVMISFASQFA